MVPPRKWSVAAVAIVIGAALAIAAVALLVERNKTPLFVVVMVAWTSLSIVLFMARRSMQRSIDNPAGESVHTPMLWNEVNLLLIGSFMIAALPAWIGVPTALFVTVPIAFGALGFGLWRVLFRQRVLTPDLRDAAAEARRQELAAQSRTHRTGARLAFGALCMVITTPLWIDRVAPGRAGRLGILTVATAAVGGFLWFFVRFAVAVTPENPLARLPREVRRRGIIESTLTGATILALLVGTWASVGTARYVDLAQWGKQFLLIIGVLALVGKLLATSRAHPT